MWPASPCAVLHHRELSEPHLTTSQAQGRNELKATEGRGGRAFGKHPQQLLPPPRLSLSYLQPRLSSFLGRTNRGLAGCRQPRNIAEIFRLRSPLEGGSVQGGGTQRVGAPARGGARSSVSAPDIAVDRGRAEGLQVFWEAGREPKIASASRGVRAHRRRGEVWQELLEEGGKGHLIIHQPPPHSPGGHMERCLLPSGKIGGVFWGKIFGVFFLGRGLMPSWGCSCPIAARSSPGG